MKKTAILLIAVMLFAAVFAACGDDPGEQQFVPKNPGTLPYGTEVKAPENPMPKYQPEITITVMGMDYSPEGDVASVYNGKAAGPKNQAFNDVAREKLGIKLEYLSSSSPAQYDTQLSLAINTGNIPDVFATSNPIVYELVRSYGFVTDLKDQFYNLNAEIQGMYLNNFYSSLESCMDEGSLYAFPTPANPYEFAKRIYIRKDWLDISGKTIPQTAEQLIDVAKAFKANAQAIAATQTGVNANQIIPIGIHKDLSYVDNYGPTGLFELFGAQVGAYFMGSDETLYAANTSSEMKTAVAAISQMYADGIIAPEFYNKTSATVATEVIQGKVGIIFGDWWVPEYPLGNSVSNANTPGADWVAVNLVGYGGKEALPIVKPIGISTYNVVSHACQHPEALPRLINLFYDMYYNDNAAEIYGERATQAGGFFHNWVPVKVWNGAASIEEHKRVNEVFEELYEAGYRVQNLAAALTETDLEQVSSHAVYGTIIDKLKTREKTLHFLKGYAYFQSKQFAIEVKDMTPAAKAGFGIYEEMIAFNGGYAYVTALTEGRANAKLNYFYGTATEAMQSKGEYVTTYLVTQFTDMIKNGFTEAKWNTFVENYDKNGGRLILNEVNGWYKAQVPLK